MGKIEIYTTQLCGFCYRAKKLLQERGLAFTEIDVMMDPVRRLEMIERADGRRTVPQIFINDKSVGGYEDLYALDQAGRLMPMLQAAE